jgi:alpha-N-arabinofuranosidase
MGYWGYPLRPDMTYKGSLYAKADAGGGSLSPLHVNLVSNKTGKSVAGAEVPSISAATGSSIRLPCIPGRFEPSEENHFELTVTKPGTLWIDRWCRVSADVQESREWQPRRPDGNALPGCIRRFCASQEATISKATISTSAMSGRRQLGRWSTGRRIRVRGIITLRTGWGCSSSWSGAKTCTCNLVLAVYGGYSMQQEHVEPGPALEPYVQDALDEIEYATGGTDTKWGAERAKDGHPAPFKLAYVEVGNEDWFDQSGSYDGRFKQFHDAIKAKYPDQLLIATAPVKSVKPDVLDDHFYLSAENYFNDIHHYDKFDRNGPKIFMGEYATMEGSPTADFGAALGDAAWLTGRGAQQRCGGDVELCAAACECAQRAACSGIRT